MIRLESFVRPDLAFDSPKVENQRALFEFVSRRLVERGLVHDYRTLVDELSERERQGSTGVGQGIALPHATHESAQRMLVVVVRLTEPMDWDSVDSKPVRLVVLIIAPPRERHLYLQVLAEVARSLNQPEVRDRALKARSPERAASIIAAPPRQGFLKRNRRILFFVTSVAVIYLLAHFALTSVVLPEEGIFHELGYAKFNHPPWLLRQELTVTLFLAMVIGTLLFWRFRLAIAAASLGILLVAGVMDLETTVKFMSIPTILFIMSMMVIVRWLESIGVFRYLVVKAVEKVRGVPWLLLLVLMGFSVLLGGFADEVSAILITFGLALEVSRRTKAPLVPFLLCLVFSTNVGSAITLIGNPIGVYIAFAGKLSFEHFLRWATPVSVTAAVAVAGLCLLLYRRHFFGKRYDIDVQELNRTTETVNPARLRTGLITFLVTVVLIALHRRMEVWLGLNEGTVLVAVALTVVGFVVFSEQERGRRLIERGIDWWTLLFFMFLFGKSACLEYTGVTTKLGYFALQFAQSLSGTVSVPGGPTGTIAVLMLWVGGFSSGFVDNLPIVAALVPVVKDLVRVGLPHASILWWALLFGGCFGGNLTVIGSTANLVAVGAFERATGGGIRFAQWFKVGIIVTVVSLVIATLALLVQIPMAP
ncbi:MAG: PTS sugar transporter subunit IIA [candidate division WOR-3 bacterium]|nr:MAG: PTS sugar transporter subunit IIA [candidate division WOR-3 bacterium]